MLLNLATMLIDGEDDKGWTDSGGLDVRDRSVAGNNDRGWGKSSVEWAVPGLGWRELSSELQKGGLDIGEVKGASIGGEVIGEDGGERSDG
jgi:hypothetical protein